MLWQDVVVQIARRDMPKGEEIFVWPGRLSNSEMIARLVTSSVTAESIFSTLRGMASAFARIQSGLAEMFPSHQAGAKTRMPRAGRCGAPEG